MKKLFFAAAFLWASAGCFAQDNKEVLAVPNYEGGYYLFMESKPAGNYEFLSSEKIKVVLFSTDECKTKILKRAEASGANGVIFKGRDWCKVDLIRIEK